MEAAAVELEAEGLEAARVWAEVSAVPELAGVEREAGLVVGQAVVVRPGVARLHLLENG